MDVVASEQQTQLNDPLAMLITQRVLAAGWGQSISQGKGKRACSPETLRLFGGLVSFQNVGTGPVG